MLISVLFEASLSLAPEVLAETYMDLECQYYIIPSKLSGRGPDAENDYGYEEPEVPGLTKAGFIKMQVLGLILETGPIGSSSNGNTVSNTIFFLCVYFLVLHPLEKIYAK